MRWRPSGSAAAPATSSPRSRRSSASRSRTAETRHDRQPSKEQALREEPYDGAPGGIRRDALDQPEAAREREDGEHQHRRDDCDDAFDALLARARRLHVTRDLGATLRTASARLPAQPRTATGTI